MAPGNSFFFSNKANSKGLKLQMKEYSCWFNLKRLASNSFNPEKSKLAVKKHFLSLLRPLRREFAYRHRFWVETAILQAFLAKNSDFDHFWGIFRVKNSNFTVFGVIISEKHRHHHFPTTQSILKRYHTSPNSKNFLF